MIADTSTVLPSEDIAYYREFPVAFIRRTFGVEPDPQQKRFIMLAAKNDSVAVKSGHGTGKTAVFAWLTLWFLTLFPYSRVVATAPTQRQLLDILWPEIRKWLSRSGLQSYVEWRATRIVMRGNEETWFATARTSNKPENMQGFHAEHLMILVDEASGVPQDTLEAIEGARTTAGSKIIMGGNPTKISGTFYDAFHKTRAFYALLTMSSERSSNVTTEYCDRLKEKYGADSDVVRVRVKGEFPRAEPDVFISLDLVEAACVREDVDSSGLITVGCDPARFGDAESVIYWRQGMKLNPPIVRTGMDTVWIAGEIARLVRHIHNDLLYEPRISVMVDETGLGAGVVDNLVALQDELWIEVVPVNFGGTGNDECYDRASVLLWNIRELLPEISMQDDDDTVAQLTTRKYRLTSNGKIRIESKDEMRRRGLVSPDRADAMGLCFHQPQISVTMTDKTREALRARRGR